MGRQCTHTGLLRFMNALRARIVQLNHKYKLHKLKESNAEIL